jgi:cell division protein FtsB
MRTFLCLMIAAALGGAGYEYYLHAQETANYVQQRSAFSARIDELKKENKDLADGNAALTSKLNSLPAQQPAATNAAPAATPSP